MGHQWHFFQLAEFIELAWDAKAAVDHIRILNPMSSFAACKICFGRDMTVENTFASVETCEQHQNSAKILVSHRELCKVHFGRRMVMPCVTKKRSC